MKKSILAVVILAVAVPLSAAQKVEGKGDARAKSEVGAIAVSHFADGELGALAIPRGPRAQAIDERVWREAARQFARAYVMSAGGSGIEDFESVSVVRDDLGQVHIRMQQHVLGLPVVGGDLIVHADAKSGNVLGVNGDLVSAAGLPSMPHLAPFDAFEQALELFEGWLPQSAPELVYVVRDDGAVVLAWSMLVRWESEEGTEIDRIFVDAIDGSLADRHPTIHRGKYRKTYTCKNGTSLPGTLLFSEGGSSSDTVAMAAYNNGGKTYDYYWYKHSRDSYNGSGATINQSVHYGSNYNNAFWNGSQMVYGDGDGVQFAPLAKALDVVAHELTHAVTQYEANLTYKNESGALNEAMSDVFAAAVEAYKDGSVNTDTWKIGEDVYTPGTSGDALRYMNYPTKDGSSRDYYQERYVGTSDNGGVHINSGIGNLAFYLLVKGGTHPRSKTSVSVSGIGMAPAEKIYYRALTVYMTSSTDFRRARDLTVRAANDLYGSSSTQAASVGKSWDAVGNAWTKYSASISTSGGSSIQPSGSYYYSGKSGYHTGHLFGPSGTDFDLYLQKWNGSSWANVAKAETSSSTELIQYNGSSGYYRWRIVSYSGTGTYTLYGNRPQ